MELYQHPVPVSLRRYVGQAWGYRAPANPTGRHRGLPSRYLTLVVELAAPLRVTARDTAVAAHGVAGGLHTNAVDIDASTPQEGLQYALTPAGSLALLGVPAGELTGLVLDLADVLGRDGDRLVDRLRATGAWGRRFRLLDGALLQRLGAADAARTEPEVLEAWRLLLARDGQVRVSALADHVGWSRRHLTARFTVAIGLPPKQAARVARFEAARTGLLAGLSPATVAARCGYADQPHLAREWHALAGCSVGTWLREELPYLQDGTAPVVPASRA
ncbi:helix-turn-helix domain-containing protein [Ornithinicoccus halotolerans]|uniref:helix-turn-helix domain-containing protein n=1 Tax=Ornithinicoccus halotolerans TaxID=1748220 RepID=UPI001297C9E0|nr:helix-turn-helix domain-containing protein [Ornithinicoccus halotolerans]